MKRTIHILMIAVAMASFCSVSRGETMAERKQRIMRKYLRERQDVVQNDLLIPVVPEEDEQVIDSEKYRADVDLKRRSSPPPTQVPVVRPMPVQAQNNWMLNPDKSDFDPNADPFADEPQTDTSTGKSDWLSEWRKKQSERAAEREAAAPVGTYNSMNAGNPYATGQGQSGYSSQQSPYSSGYTPYGSETPSSYYTPSSSGRVGPYGTMSYGTTPSGMLQLPGTSTSRDDSDSPTTSGYTPYQSPYQKQMEERRSQYTPQQSDDQQEFTRPTPYKQWQDNNKGWDPTSDDAYLDELMRRNRR